MSDTNITPIGANSTVIDNFTTKNAQFQQKFENMPVEMTEQARFFLVGANKKPLTVDWSNPSIQKDYTEINGFAGFDCSGHGLGDDYFFCDFDHIIDGAGNFINDSAEEFVTWILNALGGYCEVSISKTGLHIFAVPTIEYAGLLPTMGGGRKATYYFTDERGKDCPKLEIFYRTQARYCFLTGNVYECDPQTPITCGETADNAIKNILTRIAGQIESEKKSQKDSTQVESRNTTIFDSEIFTDEDRAMAMIGKIDVSQLPDSDWLAFMSACKNLGISYNVVDAKNRQDSERYNEQENLTRWDSLDDSSFGIETLHGLAKRFGYREKDFQREWYETHDTEQKTFSSRADATTNLKKLSREDKFTLFSLPHTDVYNAKRLEIFHGDHIRYLTDSGRWLSYKKNIWLDGGKENSAILPFALNLSETISANADSTNEAEVKLSKKWQKKSTFTNAIEILKGIESIRITERDLNTHKNLLNCKNGVVDLQTKKLYPHDSKFLLTQCVNADFRAGFQNEVVDKFLRDVLPDDDTRAALLRYLGYCLTGEISAEKALFIHGRGGNGKGTLTKMLLALLGSYACGFPIEAILTQPRIKDADTATPAFNKLLWCRLAVAEEIPAGRKLDYAKFKILTGGDALPIRKLYHESSEISDPTQKMIFSGNHLPELDDAHDPGILRRWIQIKFEQDFNGGNCDESLKPKLQTADALSALLNLLIENSAEWYKHGLLISGKMQRAKDAYFAANDFVSEFISEFCERGDGLSVKRKDFLQRLKFEYSAETRGKSDQELTSAVLRIDGIGYRRTTGGSRKFFNIALRDSDFQENLGADFIPPSEY